MISKVYSIHQSEYKLSVKRTFIKEVYVHPWFFPPPHPDWNITTNIAVVKIEKFDIYDPFILAIAPLSHEIHDTSESTYFIENTQVYHR